MAKAYAEAAEEAGYTVRRLQVAKLDFPIMRTKEDFETAGPRLRVGNARWPFSCFSCP
jgi:hypothetical protein